MSFEKYKLQFTSRWLGWDGMVTRAGAGCKEMNEQVQLGGCSVV